jgi:hypothetical protein
VVFAGGEDIEDDAEGIDVSLDAARAFGRDEAFSADEAAAVGGARDEADVGLGRRLRR